MDMKRHLFYFIFHREKKKVKGLIINKMKVIIRKRWEIIYFLFFIFLILII
jgi:hypothetical protein